jgi:hypothetical protein
MECYNFRIHDWWMLSRTKYYLFGPMEWRYWLLTGYYLTGGPRSAFGSAVACGILLGVFEGVGVLINRAFSEANRQILPPRQFLNDFPWVSRFY